jgi:hypothetical protein
MKIGIGMIAMKRPILQNPFVLLPLVSQYGIAKNSQFVVIFKLQKPACIINQQAFNKCTKSI